MTNLRALKMFASLAALTFGVVSVPGCAADADEDDVTTEESTGTSEDELTGGGCKSRATFLAHANRVCGPSNHVIEWKDGNTRYRNSGEWRRCTPNFYISVPFHCK